LWTAASDRPGEAQIERLEGVFAELDETPRGKTGDAITRVGAGNA
jgi:hypothetical protein